MAIALHHPEELYARNKSLKRMTREQLLEFARTKEKNLPRVKRRKKEDGWRWSGSSLIQ